MGVAGDGDAVLPTTLHARPRTVGGLRRRLFPWGDVALTDPDGHEVAALHVQFGRPNEFVASGLDGPIRFTQRGVLVPRFDARSPSGALLATLEYELVTGASDLVLPDGRRHRLERVGLLLPTTRLVGPSGRPVLEVEATRLAGREHRVTLRPEGEWTRDLLLVAVGLVFHAQVTLTVLFSAAASAGALAPSRPARAPR